MFELLNCPVQDPVSKVAYISFPGHNTCCIPGKLASAIRAVVQIRGAVPVVHGPVGCSWQRKLGTIIPGQVFYNVPCSNLLESHVVFGGEGRLFDCVLRVFEVFCPDMIVILTTCTSDMIGDDVETVVQKLKQKLKTPIIYSTGNKAGKMKPVGSQDVFYSIVEQYVVENVRDFACLEKCVNIQVLGVHGVGEFDELINVLERSGVKVVHQYFQGTRVRDLLDMARVEMNITPYRQLWCEYLRDKYGVKEYHLFRAEEADLDRAYPSGISGFWKVCLDIGRALNVEGEIESILRDLDRKYQEHVDKLRRELSNIKIGVDSYGLGIALTLARDFNIKVTHVIYYTKHMRAFGLSEKAIRDRLNNIVEIFRRYGSEPELIVDKTVDEACDIVRGKVDLMIVSKPYLCHRRGIRAVSSRLLGLKIRQHVTLGYEATLKLGRMILTFSKRDYLPRASLYEFKLGETYPGLPDYWDRIATTFLYNRLRI